jgi:HAD superfamily hydrolase (TIGR01509 family)
MKRPRAILFDHDGVLVASEQLHWAAWGLLSKEIGIPFDEPLVRAAVGKTAPQILGLLMASHRPDWDGNPDQVQIWIDRKNDHYLAEAKKGLRAYPGVEDGLKWMRTHGVKAAVVSNARRRELQTMLDHLGLSPLFETIISREDAKAAKPHPRPYLFATEILGVDPAECIAIEDSPPGLEAALMAGIPTAAVLTNFQHENLKNPVPGRPDLSPFWIGDSMVDFFEMISSLK